MNIKDAIVNRRSIRKFTNEKIKDDILKELVDFARLAATAANMQPLKYVIIKDKSEEIFRFTKWAGYLDDGTPKEGERPTAYIAVLGDKNIKKEFNTDAGAAVTNMMLGAMEYGIASCWLGAIDRPSIMSVIETDNERYELLYLLALGYPAQKSIAEDMADENVKYWEEKDEIHVPKRTRDEVLIKIL